MHVNQILKIMTLVKRFSHPFSVFDNFLNEDFDRWFPAEGRKSTPAVNVKETDTEFSLEVIAPGYKKDDFKLKLDKGMITISASFEDNKEEKEGEKVIRKEYRTSSFSRSFTLPENINVEGIGARYEDGLLKVALPKLEMVNTDGSREISVS